MSPTIHQLLKEQAEQNPDAIAMLAPGRAPLDYRSLYQHVEELVKSLNGFGIHRNDRVAIVLPNGAEMATAFLGVAAGATCAPLNPSYRANEFDFYLSDIHARAVIVQSGFDSPVRDVAKARGISILEVTGRQAESAGIFHIAGNKATNAPSADFSKPEDVALILHTSGTTSRPKIVPLTQKNICASARNTKDTLQLTGRDRCLNVMPLFHIHGLMAAVLSSLTAGASIVCTPGFQADSFFVWLSEYHPTWYTAVPTMHQSVLARVAGSQPPSANGSLRFIRSSSASLPPQIMKGLEEAFQAPVIEAYGMTEASHQMASNPLPPRGRKPGSVGIAAGPEIRIMDEAGNFLSAGEPGEIVIRGENVTIGYENNPSANQSAFINGWFRTGDQGVMDEEGYLSITGRIKEMVNRGGEKVAPREVDEALMDHPDVIQAVAFAAPHKTLGEDLVAAVVLRKESVVTERELRTFAFSRLADYKVPSQIVIVDEIPKGPTGKLQRIGLAEKLAGALKPEYAAPGSELEETLVGVWEKVLGVERIGIKDNFFSLGGDSLLAASVILEMEKHIGKELQPPILFQAPTIEQLSGLLRDEVSHSESYIVPIRPHGSKKPFFLVPGHGGDVFTYVHLTRHLDPDQPVYVFRFPEPARQDDKVANHMLWEMATLYVREMRNVQPEGPYLLGGFCYGGEVAFEMAQQLRVQGQATDLLAIIYVYLQGAIHLSGFRERLAHHIGNFMKGNAREKAHYIAGSARKVIERISRRLAPSLTRQLISPPPDRTYYPMYYPGTVALFRPTEDEREGLTRDRYMGWNGLAKELILYEIPGDRYTIFKQPHVQTLAEKLRECLDRSME